MTRNSALLLLVCLLLHACGDDATTDGGSADGPDALQQCEEGLSLEPAPGESFLDSVTVPAGGARAGRIRAEQMPEDRTGLARGKEGDYLLVNERIGVLIEDVGVSDGFDPWGGRPVGLSLVQDGALAAPADLSEMIPGLGRFVIAATHVGVLADGTDGGAAIVRVVGPLEPLPLVDAFARSLFSQDFSGLQAAMDYVLEPGAEHVTMHLRVAHDRPRATYVRQALLLAFQANRLDLFGPDGSGFDSAARGEVDALLFARPGQTGFAWEDPGGELTTLLSISNLNFLSSSSFELEACTVTDHAWARLHVGGPSVVGVQAALGRYRGEPEVRVRGRVLEEDGSPAPMVRVHATRGEDYLGRALSDEDGGFELLIESGDGDVGLTAWREADYPVTATASSDGESELRFGARGTLELSVRDAADDSVSPARVQLIPIETTRSLTAPPDSFGESHPAAGRLLVAYPPRGELVQPLPVGRYQLVVSRGYEYEAHTAEIEVEAGGTVVQEARLERAFATPGVLCGDFHIHTHRSFDTRDTVGLKIRAIAAEGVEIAARSDHEWSGDFEPAIAEAGLGELMYGIASLELTTFKWGHMGVFPLDPQPDAANLGAPSWYGRRPTEVFDELRGRAGVHGGAAVIINHPRGGGSLLAYFEAAGYDPVTGEVSRPELWDETFRLVEVFNASDFDANRSQVVTDWFSLLNSGREVFAVGSSDSHQVASTPVGYPRTCVDVDVDTPSELRRVGAGRVRDAMLAGKHSISGGIFVEATARGDVGTGGIVMSAGEAETLQVRVRAPLWVPVDRLRIFVNGEQTHEMNLGEAELDPLNPTTRFDGMLEIALPAGVASWVIVVVSGEGDLSPVHPRRRPFGVTNPIFYQP